MMFFQVRALECDCFQVQMNGALVTQDLTHALYVHVIKC